jgi:hypothetical protein
VWTRQADDVKLILVWIACELTIIAFILGMMLNSMTEHQHWLEHRL